jgi:ribonuclease R
LFVKLSETGADGLVPMRSLPADFYHHDERHHRLVGKRTRRTFTLGDPVEVRLAEADVVTGGLIMALLPAGADDAARPGKAGGGRGRDRPGGGRGGARRRRR